MLEKFISENLEYDVKSFETTDDLYNRYLKYCTAYNYSPVSRTKFGHEVRKGGIGARYLYKGKVARWGVKLLPCKY